MGKIDFNIGEFDTSICLCQQQIVRESSGAVTKRFEPFCKVYAKIGYNKLNEVVGAEQIRVLEVLEIVTYLREMDNSWRLKLERDDYEIISVEPICRRFMKITCKKI